jgi:transcriptional regulator of acetoin/glycerol metabolism
VGGDGPLTVEDLGLAGPAPAVPEEPLSGEEEAERQHVLAALTAADGVVAHAAADLGISRQAFYRKMARFGIEVERRPKA